MRRELLTHRKRFQQNSNKSAAVFGKCLRRLDLSLGSRLVKSLNTPANIGSNFLKITVVTAKFLSSLSILLLNSWFKLVISPHLRLFSKNSTKLRLDVRRSRVKFT